jgi:hypothetical protein
MIFEHMYIGRTGSIYCIYYSNEFDIYSIRFYDYRISLIFDDNKPIIYNTLTEEYFEI